MEDELEQRALYSIKESVKGLALTTERLADQLDELETDHKQHYEDLCSYLLNGPQTHFLKSLVRLNTSKRF
ncbi:hypothetical protein [Pseudomonas fluorescens]|uniref:Uncharacterized protein n=1 Tax=Pseudomonas fluorescens TaxID=294 RepID=A0A5E6Y3A9_PSEFL|nr:hypothetical protein [Pseudomonas fluorescens]VVN47970.1 hypothetical protein PS655_06034 [Pseudomonas fluorescens]VVP61004.1 hypothetical protein PS870_06232 [Pseudomonas fluorescens]